MFLHLAGIFVILYIILQKLFASRDCPPQLFITTCGTMCSLKYTANTGDFIFDLHTKFLKNFRAAKKRNIFSRKYIFCKPYAVKSLYFSIILQIERALDIYIPIWKRIRN